MSPRPIRSLVFGLIALSGLLGLNAAGAAASGPASVKSGFAVVVDDSTGEILYGKNETTSVPIASISKLMTAIVTLDAGLPLDEPVQITDDDVRVTAPNRSRLEPGAVLSRADVLHVALMASDNRAAVALGRTYPGGMPAFVMAMNAKTVELGMTGSHFAEPSGLSQENVSTAADLARLISTAKDYPLIAAYSTDREYTVSLKGQPATFHSTNALVRVGDASIALQKTGFTNAAGQCLVMHVKAAARSVTVVLLNSLGRYTPVADFTHIRQWLDPNYVVPHAISQLTSPAPAHPVPVKAGPAALKPAAKSHPAPAHAAPAHATPVHATPVHATPAHPRPPAAVDHS